ncbi:hypothetical protein DLJ53_28840 [Acuticoccus sediminis]|uniref:Arc-like DNA binding domain-containing protein n=1 Tax=Acuticoccus sediminis TaxID=2184697 RepID=A0A8B2NKH3_9HYPH|nr:Arc family DNA-binding protein [Acuticoccus sediminis]RAH97841.1 hypothetical protein DLJ53_28840 [Acuticoccus sediminis]
MSRPRCPSAEQDQFVVRFPDGLRDRVKAYAERNGRSMNTEIIRVLEASFPADGVDEIVSNDDQETRLTVRIPAWLSEKAKARAKEGGRSLNSEIAMAIEGSLSDRPASPAVDGFELRDWLAGQALSGMCANAAWNDTFAPDIVERTARTAYSIADAMMRAREGGA